MTWAEGPSRIDTINPTRGVKREEEKDMGKDRFKYRITAGKIRTVARHSVCLIGGLSIHMHLKIWAPLIGGLNTYAAGTLASAKRAVST